MLDKIVNKLIDTISQHGGCAIFAEKRAKFEGWVKVELARIFSELGYEVEPEKLYFIDKEHQVERHQVDLFSESGNTGLCVELKTVNTSYKGILAKKKTRPITMNVNSVLEDLEKLSAIKGANPQVECYVLFLVYPCESGNEHWQMHERRLKSRCASLSRRAFSFKNGERGLVYVAKV